MDNSIALGPKTLWVLVLFFQLFSYQNILADTKQRNIQKITVLDGDSFHFNGESWRLWGIDAPELFQTCISVDSQIEIECGKMSKNKLKELMIKPISCKVKDIDKYKRKVGMCKNAIGIDINEQMIIEGFAFDYRRYSDFYFDKQEKQAKANKSGLWKTEFLWPWHWRKENPR